MSIYEYDEEREMKLIREDERELGREEGIEIGQKEILLLTRKLLEDNRVDDLKRVTQEEAYRVRMCEEYGIG